MGKLVFCYWNLRGLGAPAVNMLEYGGIDYEHKLADAGWFTEKFQLGFDFPNLPYVIDGDVRITESWAIYKYIAKKANLMPPPGDEFDRQSDMLQGVIQDIRSKFTGNCYSPDCYAMADKVRETQEKKLEQMEKFLKTKQFLVGNKLTYLDFVLFETLDHHRLFFTDILSGFPSISAYMERFENQDRMKAFFESDRYHQFPINGGMATWGGKDHNDKK